MRDLVLEHRVGGKPDGVEILRLVQPRIDCRDRIGGVSPEEPQDVPRGIPGDHRIEDVAPAIGAMDVSIVQGTAFQHAELVEQKVRVVAGALTNARSRRTPPDCRATNKVRIQRRSG